MESNRQRRTCHVATLTIVLVTVFLAWHTWGCGGSDSTPAPTQPAVTVQVTDFDPALLDSEIAASYTVTGSGFAPVGGVATVRFEAETGTPFLGHSSGSIVMTGSIDSATEISGLTAACGVTGSVDALVSVTLPDASVGTSSGPLVTLNGPTISGFVPATLPAGLVVPFIVTGDGFGPNGAMVQVEFTAVSGTPFLGGTSASVTVVGTVDSATQVSGHMPPALVSASTPTTVKVICPSGAEASSSGPVVTFEPTPQPLPRTRSWRKPILSPSSTVRGRRASPRASSSRTVPGH